MPEKFKKIGNILLFALVMIFYIEGVFLLVFTMICLSFLKVKRGTRLLKNIWIHLTMSALSYLFPKPMFICYDPKIINKTKNIIISNHLSEFDWLMILSVLCKVERFTNVCIVLKDSLKNIPLLGYGMRFLGYIFLNRRIEVDREIIKTGIKRLKGNGDFDLLLFPEGTYLDSESNQVTHKYIKKNPCFLDGKEFIPSEVLLPRITGFNIIRESLKGDVDGVIDITMLVNPYKKFPQDYYSYMKALTDFKDRIGFVLFLDYHEDLKDKDFIFRRFQEKDKLIKKYRKLNFGEIKTQEDFILLTHKLKKYTKKYSYDTVFVKSEWSLCFYILFIFTVLFVVCLIKK